MINFSVLIPLLEVLFNQVKIDETEKIGELRNFEFSIQYIRNIFYAHFNEMIVNEGRKEALKFVCLVILSSVFLANLFRYLSAVIVARVRVRVVTNIRNSLYEKIINLGKTLFLDWGT